MAEGSPSLYMVCNICLSAIDPSEASLLISRCFKPDDYYHARAPKVPVWWNVEKRRMERVRSIKEDGVGQISVTQSALFPGVRPLPHELPPSGKRFILCDRGWRCGGDKCTFAHSVGEKEAWNEQLHRQHSGSSLLTVGAERRYSNDEKIGCK